MNTNEAMAAYYREIDPHHIGLLFNAWMRGARVGSARL